MSTQQRMQPNPRRSEAAKRNRAKRKGVTEEGRQKLREAAIANKPWLHATGPTTLAGKFQSVINGKVRQKGEYSVREARAQVKASHEFLRSLVAHTELGVFDM